MTANGLRYLRDRFRRKLSPVVSVEPEPLPDTWMVLSLLTRALKLVAADAELEIHLGGLDEASGGVPIVDAAGRVVASVHGHVGSGDDPTGSEVLSALVASYGYVLEAERAVQRMTVRVEELERVAYLDPLTGLLNRRAWEEAVLREQARCVRHPRPVAIVVVDLDELKAVNDENGHLAGDVLLRLTGGLLREILRPSDTVARIGGDEFAVLVVDVVDEAPARLAERIRRSLADEGVRASVGAAISPTGERLHAALHSADAAMYRTKPKGPRPE